MSVKLKLAAASIMIGLVAGASSIANAACVTKGAKATSTSTKSAKWFALETIVQQVSWGAWPAWVASGKMPGYVIKNERYKCSGSGSVTCLATATICEE